MMRLLCRLIGHRPVYFTDLQIAGCSRCHRPLDAAAEYAIKFPREFGRYGGERYLGDDACETCSGDGWDADWSGPYRCTACWGTGRKLREKTFR